MRKLRNPAIALVASVVLFACGGTSTDTTVGPGSTTQPPVGTPTTTTTGTPVTTVPGDEAPEGLPEAAGAMWSAFEPLFGSSSQEPERPMSLCGHEIASPPGSTAALRFRRAESDGTERSLFIDLLATNSAAEAAQKLEELAAGIASCGPHAREDIASDGVWVASRDTMLGQEGIRWSDDLISRGPGGRLHDAFITSSGRFVVQVWAESRSVFQATFDSMERPIPLLEESLQTALDILTNR